MQLLVGHWIQSLSFSSDRTFWISHNTEHCLSATTQQVLSVSVILSKESKERINPEINSV